MLSQLPPEVAPEEHVKTVVLGLPPRSETTGSMPGGSRVGGSSMGGGEGSVPGALMINMSGLGGGGMMAASMLGRGPGGSMLGGM